MNKMTEMTEKINTDKGDDILNLGIGNPVRTVTIQSVDKNEITMRDERKSEKISFSVEDNNGRTFDISDVWVLDHKGDPKIQGLWFTLSADKQISPGSSLAKLMSFYEVGNLKDFINKEVQVYPDAKDFLVLVACDTESL